MNPVCFSTAEWLDPLDRVSGGARNLCPIIPRPPEKEIKLKNKLVKI